MGQRLERFRKLALRVRRDPMRDIRDLAEIEARAWGRRIRAIQSFGEPMAGLGFTGVVYPNMEPTTSLPAVGTTAETVLYVPGITGGAASVGSWPLLPLGTLRMPQSYCVLASGIWTTTGAAQFLNMWTRIGVSATAANNASISYTGSMTMPSTIAAGPWMYQTGFTVRSIAGSAATAIGMTAVDISGSIGGAVSGASATRWMGGGTLSPNFDPSTQQGVVISVGATAATTTVTLQQFTLVAWD